MRHCLTAEGPQMDAERTLNDVGEEQAHVMRKFLKAVNVKPDIIVSSDFARAHDTAKIMQRGDTPLETTPTLRPDGDASKAWKAIAKLVDKIKKDPDHNPAVLIVTHSPLIYPLLEAVAFCFIASRCWVFQHGAIAYANTSEASFRWIVTPKLAAHIVQHDDPKEVENPIGEAIHGTREVFGEGVIAVAENLRRAHKAAAVDPLIAKLKGATQRRFRRQWTRVKIAMRKLKPRWSVATYSEVRVTLQAAIVIHDRQYKKVFDAVTQAAREAGAQHVGDQLGIKVREAAPPAKKAMSPPPRTAEHLEDDLDDTTDRETGNELKDSFDAVTPLSYAAVLEALRQQFAQYADGIQGQVSRAETVAVTEISGAYHDGGHAVAMDAPAETEKLWDGEDDMCPECQANADMDWIPSPAPFDSGDDTAPAHPNCRCSVSYRRNEGESWSGYGEDDE
jgi:phosphohistidine phosphatase SixA